MKYIYKDNSYDIDIIRKNNKNTYLRFKDGKIIVTTNYFVTNKAIFELVSNNKNFINAQIEKSICEDNNTFSLFGIEYSIIFINGLSEAEINDNKIYAKDQKQLDKYLNTLIHDTYLKRVTYWYNCFEEKLPSYNLKIRKMTSRWGVCNLKNNNVTLNLNLSKYAIKYLDYVIIHELAHFIQPNHSKEFWQVVAKYCKEYKQLRKDMKSFS